MRISQQQQGLQMIIDEAVTKGISLMADALRDVEDIREIKRGIQTL